MTGHAFEVLKVFGVNGTTLAVVTMGDLQQWLSVALLAVTLLWTILKLIEGVQSFIEKRNKNK